MFCRASGEIIFLRTRRRFDAKNGKGNYEYISYSARFAILLAAADPRVRSPSRQPNESHLSVDEGTRGAIRRNPEQSDHLTTKGWAREWHYVTRKSENLLLSAFTPVAFSSVYVAYAPGSSDAHLSLSPSERARSGTAQTIQRTLSDLFCKVVRVECQTGYWLEVAGRGTNQRLRLGDYRTSFSQLADGA